MSNIVDVKQDEVFGTIYNLKHTDEPINGINGNPFVNFNNHCDFDLERIDEEICLGLSKIDTFKVPTVPGKIPPKLKSHEQEVYEYDVLYDYNGDVNKFKGMDYQQIRKYFFYKQEITLPWYFMIELKPNKLLTKTKDLEPWNDTSTLFPYTKYCIEQMPFKEIGRVVIYGSWPDSKVPCHRDHIPSKECDHHINFNPGGYRPVYIYDSVNNQKHYLPEDYKFYAYNTTDYHGVDSVSTFSYTVRVDGTYDLTKVKF
jgi:hypothetical protein